MQDALVVVAKINSAILAFKIDIALVATVNWISYIINEVAEEENQLKLL